MKSYIKVTLLSILLVSFIGIYYFFNPVMKNRLQNVGIEKKLPQNIVKIKVNLSELNDLNEKELKKEISGLRISKNKGWIETDDVHFRFLIKKILKDHLLTSKNNKFSFYPELSWLRVNYWEYVVSQLPDFVRYGEKYSGYSKKGDGLDRYLSYIIYRLDRSPENLKLLFDTYKDFIYSNISEKTFTKMKIRDYLDGLIDVFKHIKSIDGYKERLSIIALKTKDVGEGEYYHRTIATYPLYKNIINKETVKQFSDLYLYTDGKDKTNTTIIWLHSFWVRRHVEGNADTVYSILNEISEFYGKKGM